MTDRVGQLGNYQLLRLLGEGGFAEVYLGEHIHLGTQAAIKVLHTQLTSDDIDKFRTEARTIARLIHPHIVRVLEFGVEGKTPFLVMDYAPNGTLRQRHPKGVALPLPLIVAYVKQVADALQYAHDEKLIHRDIKPENMLLGRRNDILLSDFGIALVAQSSRYQGEQEIAGTMAYMAPEQIQGKPRPASDQYSLGIVVYEWLCGDRPFHGSLSELVGQHLSVPPPSLLEKVPTFPPAVEQVVLTSLAKDPKERFGSVQAFAAALEQAYQSLQHYPPVSSVVASPPSQSSLPTDAVKAIFPEPSPLPTNIVIPQSQSSQSTDVVTPPGQSLQPTNVITPSSSLSQATFATMQSQPPDMSLLPTKEPVPFRGIQPPKGRISRRAALVSLAGLAVAGSGLTWLVRSQRSQVTPPSFRPTAIPTPTNTPTPTPIPLGTTLYTYRGHADWVHAVAWSPDGKRIASASTDGTVQVWNAVDGSNVFTYRRHSAIVWAVAWSPNGERLASGSGDWGNGLSGDWNVQVWNATDGGNVFTYRGHSHWLQAVAWSPNGQRIASGSLDETVQVWNATDGSNVFTYRGHSHGVTAVVWSPGGKRIASSGGDDTTVQVWNVTDGGNVFTYRGHSYSVGAVAWSPDGKRIASGGVDNTVQVWNATDGGNVFTYRGHSDSVHAVAWSPDGQRIASGSLDRTVQVWNAVDGSNVFTYRGHSSYVYAVAWSPDGQRIASGSGNNASGTIDHTVQVWKAV